MYDSISRETAYFSLSAASACFDLPVVGEIGPQLGKSIEEIRYRTDLLSHHSALAFLIMPAASTPAQRMIDPMPMAMADSFRTVAFRPSGLEMASVFSAPSGRASFRKAATVSPTSEIHDPPARSQKLTYALVGVVLGKQPM